jgi:hypothetical protein
VYTVVEYVQERACGVIDKRCMTDSEALVLYQRLMLDTKPITKLP